MYAIAVKRDFIAQHFLIGGDWGAENQPHSHHYQLELELEGSELNKHGYLVDIVDIGTNLDTLVARYRDACLNEKPEFAGLNPSLEHFTRILCTGIAGMIQARNVSSIKLRLWENEIAWASYQLMR